jgi:predicted nucleic-acid-binding protein
MIGLDTNVLVRYVMQDDPGQAARATRLMDSLTPEEPGFVALVCVVEAGWVLSSSYGLTRAQVALVVEGLLRTKELAVERADVVLRALRVFQASSADLADCLIAQAGLSAGCDRTMTFDRKAARLAGMALL